MEAIDLVDGGFFTTVQDLGRFGYQRYGVPVSGAVPDKITSRQRTIASDC